MCCVVTKGMPGAYHGMVTRGVPGARHGMCCVVSFADPAGMFRPGHGTRDTRSTYDIQHVIYIFSLGG